MVCLLNLWDVPLNCVLKAEFETYWGFSRLFALAMRLMEGALTPAIEWLQADASELPSHSQPSETTPEEAKS